MYAARVASTENISSLFTDLKVLITWIPPFLMNWNSCSVGIWVFFSRHSNSIDDDSSLVRWFVRLLVHSHQFYAFIQTCTSFLIDSNLSSCSAYLLIKYESYKIIYLAQWDAHTHICCRIEQIPKHIWWFEQIIIYCNKIRSMPIIIYAGVKNVKTNSSTFWFDFSS